MLTRCPKCDTLFRLTSAQIEAADGRVRCSRCNEVFNATEHLRKPADREIEVKPSLAPEPKPAEPPASPPLEEIAPIPRPIIAHPAPEREAPEPSKIDILLQPQRKEPGIGWWLLALLLALAAATQLAWLDRQSLMQDPQGQKFLNSLCGILNCTLPPRRAPDRFRVLSRDMSSHPQAKNALLFLLVMANQADFAQPYPYVQLSLFDANRHPAGQRIFKPEEYLSERPEGDLLSPDHAVYIRLELVDPGPDISGFEIKFL
ncbi:MAG: DUF3426 domain-containing protein [Gammaproteobacteria bacterium]|nr:DUF3426 domain-containing protein [Gammaproteobacteria bacterium]MBU1653431.1 DUF3426 domain-containing protein [Gammaproteobacteria bacterium]MBU1959736.1 DUF3426 domain-containing protein [Gammaproteobacteria bacterium]